MSCRCPSSAKREAVPSRYRCFLEQISTSSGRCSSECLQQAVAPDGRCNESLPACVVAWLPAEPRSIDGLPCGRRGHCFNWVELFGQAVVIGRVNPGQLRECWQRRSIRPRRGFQPVARSPSWRSWPSVRHPLRVWSRRRALELKRVRPGLAPLSWASAQPGAYDTALDKDHHFWFQLCGWSWRRRCCTIPRRSASSGTPPGRPSSSSGETHRRVSGPMN